MKTNSKIIGRKFFFKFVQQTENNNPSMQKQKKGEKLQSQELAAEIACIDLQLDFKVIKSKKFPTYRDKNIIAAFQLFLDISAKKINNNKKVCKKT